MPRTGSHWDSKLDQIKEMAGRFKAQEIADRLGVSVGSLYVACSQRGISLARPRMPTSGPGHCCRCDRPLTPDNQVEDGRRLCKTCKNASQRVRYQRSPSHWEEKMPTVRSLAGKVSAQQIADQLGVSVGALYQRCAKEGISLRVPRKLGSKKPTQKRKPGPSVSDTRAAVVAGLTQPEARADLVAGLVADLFDIDTSKSKDPVADVIRFLKRKLDT